MNGSTPERPVEARLRRAFEARAESITVRDLRPADPPGPHLRRTPLALLRVRRFALPLAALATVAAAAIGYVALAPHDDPRRPLPANSPAPLPTLPTPAPSKSPGPVVPPSSSPSVSTPPTARPGTQKPGSPTPPGHATPTPDASRGPVSKPPASPSRAPGL